MNWVLGVSLPIVGAAFLFYAGNRTNSMLRYQLITLVGAIALASIALLASDNESIFKVGVLNAQANNIIGASYLAFSLIAFAITTLVVYLQVAKGKSVDRKKFISALLWAIPLSVLNAATEELIFRATIVQLLSGLTSALTIAII